jgi:hypothetical protein
MDASVTPAGPTTAAGHRTNPANSSETNSNGCPDPNSKWNAPYPFCADNLFQFHHQPFNYYTNYARTGPNGDGPQPSARIDHLRDEQEFVDLGAVLSKALQPPRCLVHQAAGRRERASGLRQRGAGERPPGRPAQGDRGQRVS